MLHGASAPGKCGWDVNIAAYGGAASARAINFLFKGYLGSKGAKIISCCVHKLI